MNTIARQPLERHPGLVKLCQTGSRLHPRDQLRVCFLPSQVCLFNEAYLLDEFFDFFSQRSAFPWDFLCLMCVHVFFVYFL